MSNETARTMPRIVSNADSIENELESVGRIDIEELRNEPDIIRKKVDEKIKSIMDKYGYTFALTEFSWVGGQVQANIDIVEKPKDETQA